MKFAVFNKDGSLQTCLIEGVHDIPATAVAIDDAQFMRIVQETDGVWKLRANGSIVKTAPAAAAPTEAELGAMVDAAADAARAAVVGSPLMAVEYDRAAVQARAYAAADYKGDVPAMVAAWAIGERTAQQAADDIINQANLFESALIQLRTIRLSAKEQIRALFLSGTRKDIAAAQALAQSTVDTIQAAVTGLGFNA